MLAHTLTKVDEVKATCDAEGNKAYYKCSECDKYFEDETATTEITDKTSVILPALGHDYDEGKITTPKTSTTDGVKTYTCKHDSTHTITETIPAGHELEKVEAKDATCIEEGNIEYYKCSECGKKIDKTTSIKFYNSMYLEKTAVLRLIANSMHKYNTILVHGAVVSTNDYAYMLVAPSGTGQSSR